MELQNMHRAPEALYATVPSKVMADPPEKTLAFAVLTGAVYDLVKYNHPRGREATRLYQDALGWISSDDETWPYSFINLCALLDFPADRLRRKLLENPSALLGDLRQLAA